MTDDPRWHGWATPNQVKEMINEMFEFLEKTGNICHFVMATGERCGIVYPHEHKSILIRKNKLPIEIIYGGV
jgi:hypothetical protein